MLPDIRFAIRSLSRTPGFTAVALLTLALGIGVNTALFSVAREVLLHPIPFPDPDRLVLLASTRPEQGDDRVPFSLPDFLDVRDRARSFRGLAAWALLRVNLAADEPEEVQAAVTTASIFDVLGTPPSWGRTFMPDEDAAGGRAVVVIAHSLWQRRFSSDPGILGRAVSLDGREYSVVGVMPPGFRFLSYRRDTEIWMPLGPDPFVDRRYARGVRSMGAIGRLATNVSLSDARAEVDGLARQLAVEHPDTGRGRGIAVVPLAEQVVRDLKPSVVLLCGAVGCVLLIGCANVANLLLVRGAARRREMAIRSALGGDRGRLVRQLLTEHLVLAGAGGCLGVLVATWAVDLLRRLPPGAPSLFTPYAIPPERIGIDGAALAFTAALSVVTGLLVGILPALSASRRDVVEGLKQGGPQITGSRAQGRVRAALVVGQVSLAMMLLVGASLLGRSLLSLERVDPGFQRAGVLTFDVNLPERRYPAPAHAADFFSRLTTRLRGLPGVIAVGGTEFLPLSGADSSTPLIVDGTAASPGDEVRVHYRSVTAGFFEALGVRIVAGRGIGAGDGGGDARVAVVNDTLARRVWPGHSPLGRRAAITAEALRYRPDGPPELDVQGGMREIVGVAADLRHVALQTAAAPEIYIPYEQRPVRHLSIVVKTTGNPMSLAADARRLVAALDPQQPLVSVQTGDDLLRQATAQPRFNALLLSAFAGLATILAFAGVYGVVAFMVAQQRREIGIRLALGGQARDVAGRVLRRGLSLTLAGVCAGGAGALVLRRLVSGLLFGVSSTDPVAFGGAAALLLAAAAAATTAPALRALRVDPVEALRAD